MALTPSLMKTLQDKATHIQRNHLKTDSRYAHEPPFIIEVDGMSSTGKSRMAEDLDTRLRRMGFRVRFEREGSERIRYISRKTPDYNIRTGIHALSIILDEFACATHDILVIERGIFDICVWQDYWYKKGVIDRKQRDYTKCFFLDHSPKVALAFMVAAEPKAALTREMAKTHQLEAGQYSTLEQLQFFSELYHDAYEALHPKHSQIHFVDTTHLTVLDMQDMALQKSIEEIYKKTLKPIT